MGVSKRPVSVSVTSLFLKEGITFAIFSFVGKIPVTSDWLLIRERCFNEFQKDTIDLLIFWSKTYIFSPLE